MTAGPTQDASQRISLEARRCSECGSPFTPTRSWNYFCSRRCKTAAWEKSHPRRPLLAIAEAESYLAPRPLPEAPEARRDEQKAVAASNNKHQRAIARWAALMCFGNPEDSANFRKWGQRNSIVSDVREWCRERGIELEWRKPWTGSLFQHEWFAFLGTSRRAFHDGSNAREVKEWRLTDEGRAAYRAVRELTARTPREQPEPAGGLGVSGRSGREDQA